MLGSTFPPWPVFSRAKTLQLSPGGASSLSTCPVGSVGGDTGSRSACGQKLSTTRVGIVIRYGLSHAWQRTNGWVSDGVTRPVKTWLRRQWQRVHSPAPCPILVVTLPRVTSARNLVSWYIAALKLALRDHPNALMNLTAADVMAWFPPPHRLTSVRQERRAAVQAQEQPASSRILCRQKVHGEIRYLSA